MTWVRITVTAFAEADDGQEAMENVLDLIPASKEEGEVRLTTGSWEEMSSEDIAGVMKMLDILAQAKADSAAGAYITDPRYPRLQFSPQAAAQLAALEFEAGQTGDG